MADRITIYTDGIEIDDHWIPGAIYTSTSTEVVQWFSGETKEINATAHIDIHANHIEVNDQPRPA